MAEAGLRGSHRRASRSRISVRSFSSLVGAGGAGGAGAAARARLVAFIALITMNSAKATMRKLTRVLMKGRIPERRRRLLTAATGAISRPARLRTRRLRSPRRPGSIPGGIGTSATKLATMAPNAAPSQTDAHYRRFAWRIRIPWA